MIENKHEKYACSPSNHPNNSSSGFAMLIAILCLPKWLEMFRDRDCFEKGPVVFLVRFTCVAGSALLLALVSLCSIRVYSSWVLGDAHSCHLLSYWTGRTGADATTVIDNRIHTFTRHYIIIHNWKCKKPNL